MATRIKDFPKEHTQEYMNKLAAKGRKARKANPPLTLKNRIFVKEYLNTGNATAAYRRAYGKKKNQMTEQSMAHRVRYQPAVVKAINETLEKAELSDEYMVRMMKTLVDKGKRNLDETKPSDVIKMMEMFFKLKGYLGNKPVQAEKESEKLDKMTIDQIGAELKKLDQQQSRLLAMAESKIEEGEVV